MCIIIGMTKKTRPENTTGALIKRLLASNGLTQKAMADAIGCGCSNVSLKLSGHVVITADEIAKTADLLNVSADVLLGRKPLEVK